MNKSVFTGKISVILLFLSLFLFDTCKKDNEPSGPGYRVIVSNDYRNNEFVMSSHVDYQGEKTYLISSQHYSYYVADSTKTQYEYPDDNSIIGIYYEKAAGIWCQVKKEEYEIQENLLTELISSIYSEGSWQPYYKVNLQYEDGQLSEEIWTTYENGISAPFVKVTYKYAGKKVVSSMQYMDSENSWELTCKDSVTYRGDEIDYVIGYQYSAGLYSEDYKNKFLYENGLITRIEMYSYVNGYWTFEGAMTYTYDAFGNLASVSKPYGNEIRKTEFIYEEGKGNYGQLILQGGGLMANKLIPRPSKSSTPVMCECYNIFP
jgi:hypothetical protein